MLCRLKTLGCTKIVQTKCGSVETMENIEPKFGGASRDRTDDLIVANRVVSGVSPNVIDHLARPEHQKTTVQLERKEKRDTGCRQGHTSPKQFWEMSNFPFSW